MDGASILPHQKIAVYGQITQRFWIGVSSRIIGDMQIRTFYITQSCSGETSLFMLRFCTLERMWPITDE